MQDEEVLDAGMEDLVEELDRLRKAGIDGSLRAATFDTAKMRLEAQCPPAHRHWLETHLDKIAAEFSVHEDASRDA